MSKMVVTTAVLLTNRVEYVVCVLSSPQRERGGDDPIDVA